MLRCLINQTGQMKMLPIIIQSSSSGFRQLSMFLPIEYIEKETVLLHNFSVKEEVFPVSEKRVYLRKTK